MEVRNNGERKKTVYFYKDFGRPKEAIISEPVYRGLNRIITTTKNMESICYDVSRDEGVVLNGMLWLYERDDEKAWRIFYSHYSELASYAKKQMVYFENFAKTYEQLIELKGDGK